MTTPEIVTVKITRRELREIEPSLAKLITSNLPVKTAYRLSRLAKIVKKELMDMEGIRVKLVKKHGVIDDKGNHKVPDEKMDEFTKEINEFMENECSLTTIPITLDELGSLQLSAIDMANLERFILDWVRND